MKKIRQMVKNEDVQAKLVIAGFFIAFAVLALLY